MADWRGGLAVARENPDEFAGAAGLTWPDDGGMVRTGVGADMGANGAVPAGGVGGSERVALRLGGVGGSERAARGAGGAERLARRTGGLPARNGRYGALRAGASDAGRS